MSHATSSELESALRALRTYAPGASRGDLLPIDEAVRASLDQPDERATLEDQLLRGLDEASSLGQVYLLKQLILIGSVRSVPSIAERLTHPEVGDAACRTLSSMPGTEVAAALRDALPKLRGDFRLGVIRALGFRRDTNSVELLAGLLGGEDSATFGAAVTALGRIGSPSAGRVLAEHFPSASEAQRLNLRHAIRDCAARLLRAGQAETAAALLELLD